MNPSLETLAQRILSGDRRALARAITLIESRRPDHQEQAQELVERLLPATGKAVRLGISGTPGAGKSTFIEALGRHVIDLGHRIAVLAVDPSSRRSGGSILGDKTRMQRLAQAPAAFVRPSPTGGTLGGVTRRTREAALACEAAGFDVIVIETVGVGQSEGAVADMVDGFLLLIAPGGGDELQGIKRGIVELADIVVINKADGDLLAAAGRAQADYRAALQLLRPPTPGWTPEVLTCSALHEEGIEQIWQTVLRHRQALEDSDELGRKRARQVRSWLWAEVQAGLADALRADPATAELLAALEDEVGAGRLLPPQAARALIERFRAGDHGRAASGSPAADH
ncbi:MAG TPA: methylmalonyl Co-A mutase-associated GTPase MeaB [Geminicoccaceae bacterium]|nr:methylmalonyl Co-A mutase-associated GTPase MeaB [Geminicoccaceae bacterium]HZA65578.1 methylmalonyl Co-A mutase-associated GTPase MeaB [Geminicoccaceae bacterium]